VDRHEGSANRLEEVGHAVFRSEARNGRGRESGLRAMAGGRARVNLLAYPDSPILRQLPPES
jgi:hypothetical protein